jgi:hypothetical protein
MVRKNENVSKKYITTIEKPNYTINVYVNNKLEDEEVFVGKAKDLLQELMK